jgi:CubicO group peptidase (beta-lactamase class C family)
MNTPRTLLTGSSLALIAAAVPLALAGELARPESLGFSSERLKRIDTMIQRYVDAHDIPGAITVVVRRGQVVHYSVSGLMDLESGRPMSRDAIFRIASMTKPVTGVAIMMLVEEGKIHVNDPVSRFIPEFNNLQVAVPNLAVGAPGGGGGASPRIPFKTEPANRSITIRDLLTHTSGLVSGPISAQELGKSPRQPTETLADFMPRLAKLPLEFQPGSRWAYSPVAGFETLGRIVEVASGIPYDQFLRERIFQPLGMKDAYFGPPEGRAARIVSIYRNTAKGPKKEPTTDPRFLPGNRYFSGAGGLSSTADDYLQFAQMLLHGGEWNGHRLLGSRTVEWMRTIHTPDNLPGKRTGEGFGWSMRVIDGSGAAPTMLTEGSFGWDGGFGTAFWVDPKRQILGLLFIQALSHNEEIRRDFETAVMQAVID